MNLPRQEALLLFTILFVVGGAYVVSRLLASRRRGVSIRMQVFLAMALITMGVTAGFGLIVVDRFEARTVLFAHRAAREDAEVVATLIERSMELVGVSLESGIETLARAQVLQGLTEGPDDTRVQLVDRHGLVLLDTFDSAPEDTLVTRPEVIAALEGRIETIARSVNGSGVAAAVPIRSEGSVVGAVRVSKSTFGMKDVLSDLAPKVALLALILAAAAAMAGLLIGRSVAGPVERLTQAAGRIASGERQATLPAPRGREVRALTSAFEGMRRELEQRDAVEALAADLSHELKNPVASVRAAAEVLEGALDDDPKAARRFVRRITEATDRLNALLEDVLGLARLEARGLADDTARLDVFDLVTSAIEAAREHSEGLSIELIPPAAPMHVHGNRAWLIRAVSNLLANALAHTPQGGTITVTLRQAEDRSEISVRDTGPGVPESMQDRIFDRFVTTRHDSGGTGLGLAIVRAVAEAHGGRVDLTPPSTFTLRL